MPASVPLAVGTCIRTPVRIPAPCDKTSTTPQEMQKRDLYIGPLRHVTPRHRDPMRKAGAVVPVDPLDDGDLELVAGAPGAVELDQLGFEGSVQRLGHGVVVAVPDGADGGRDAGLDQAVGVAETRVLTACIRVVCEITEGEIRVCPHFS